MYYFTTAALFLALSIGHLAPTVPVQDFWQEEVRLSMPAAIESQIAPTNDIFTGEITGTMDPALLKPLDNKSTGWGQGVNADAYNRPQSAIGAQEQYGKYGAYFLAAHTDTIYLTIDEGYENGYTAQILDVLKEKECPAVFFVTMDYVKKNPALVQRMIEEGHVVGNHSTTHPAKGLPSQSLQTQAEELMKLHAYVLEHFDYEMHLFRYPAGIYSEQSLALVQQLGYHSVFWSFAYRDWVTDDQPDPAAALEKLQERLHPGAIYLLHAVSATNTKIMGDFIDNSRAAGYTFGRMA